jgi:hypothetical protein
MIASLARCIKKIGKIIIIIIIIITIIINPAPEFYLCNNWGK